MSAIDHEEARKKLMVRFPVNLGLGYGRGYPGPATQMNRSTSSGNPGDYGQHVDQTSHTRNTLLSPPGPYMDNSLVQTPQHYVASSNASGMNQYNMQSFSTNSSGRSSGSSGSDHSVNAYDPFASSSNQGLSGMGMDGSMFGYASPSTFCEQLSQVALGQGNPYTGMLTRGHGPTPPAGFLGQAPTPPETQSSNNSKSHQSTHGSVSAHEIQDDFMNALIDYDGYAEGDAAAGATAETVQPEPAPNYDFNF